jgi:hypothetical protein
MIRKLWRWLDRATFPKDEHDRSPIWWYLLIILAAAVVSAPAEWWPWW